MDTTADELVSRMRSAGKGRARFLAVLYVAALAAPPVAAMLSGQGRDGESLVYQLGRCCALTAFMILCLQVVLTGRFPLVEQAFGQDVLVRFHRRMAMAGGALLLAHPLLLAAGGLGGELFTSLELPWYIWAGKAAAMLLAANLVVSLFSRRLSLSFEGWRVAHDLLAPGIIMLVFAHSWFVKEGFPGTALAYAWPACAGASLALLAWHRIIRPRLAAGRLYTVSAVRQEVPGVWTLELAPPQGEQAYPYLPGQFQFLTLRRGRGLPQKVLRQEEHHFTISSSPVQRGFVSSTIKESGDFTATMGQTRPGDTAVVQGPFGRFSYLLHPEDTDLVFLAGGIGVTPLMGMLRHMRDTGSNLPVTFIYANRSQGDIAFREELAQIEAGGHPKLRVEHVLSRPGPGWEGAGGHLDQDLILRLCGGSVAGKSFYVCGPPGMVAAGLTALKRLGVPAGRIRREMFSFLD